MSSPRTKTERGNTARDLLWRSLNGAGLDHCRSIVDADGALLLGTAINVLDGEPATITYMVDCDVKWRTSEVVVTLLRINEKRSDTMQLQTDEKGNWTQVISTGPQRATRKLRQIEGCLDIDLAFSPATNQLPIRRLDLGIGESAEVTAAWLQIPSMELINLPQRYTRISGSTYRYEALSHDFTAVLEVDNFGMVRTYEGLWERIAEVAMKT